MILTMSRRAGEPRNELLFSRQLKKQCACARAPCPLRAAAEIREHVVPIESNDPSLIGLT